MGITTTQLEYHQQQINNASTDAAKLIAISDYYNYLEVQSDAYGALGYAVANDTEGFGRIANDMLRSGGFENQIADVRLALALEDIEQREANIIGGGSGSLSEQEIADYHYNVFEGPSINIPAEHAGMALFEFTPGISWIDVGVTGNIDGVALTQALASHGLSNLLAAGDYESANGIDFGDALTNLAAGLGSPLGEAQAEFNLGLTADGALDVGLATGSAPILSLGALADLLTSLSGYLDSIEDRYNDWFGETQPTPTPEAAIDGTDTGTPYVVNAWYKIESTATRGETFDLENPITITHVNGQVTQFDTPIFTSDYQNYVAANDNVSVALAA